MIEPRVRLYDRRRIDAERAAYRGPRPAPCSPLDPPETPFVPMSRAEAESHRSYREVGTLHDAYGRWCTLSYWWFHTPAELGRIFPETASYVAALARSRRRPAPST